MFRSENPSDSIYIKGSNIFHSDFQGENVKLFILYCAPPSTIIHTVYWCNCVHNTTCDIHLTADACTPAIPEQSVVGTNIYLLFMQMPSIEPMIIVIINCLSWWEFG